MDEPELTVEEAMQGLADLFGSPTTTPSRYCRRYVLRSSNGKLVFQFSKTRIREQSLPQDEIESMINAVIEELFSGEDELVPRKLANLFPGSFS